jgi:hypothetical protein
MTTSQDPAEDNCRRSLSIVNGYWTSVAVPNVFNICARARLLIANNHIRCVRRCKSELLR